MTQKVEQFRDTALIYHSKEDGCWIAHSLRTDQIGNGDDITGALADLIRGMKNLYDLVSEDASIAFFREAPEEIQKRAAAGRQLPGEIFDVAHKMATGKWPDSIEPNFKAQDENEQFTAEVVEPTC